jgi:hypothetical protein
MLNTTDREPSPILKGMVTRVSGLMGNHTAREEKPMLMADSLMKVFLKMENSFVQKSSIYQTSISLQILTELTLSVSVSNYQKNVVGLKKKSASVNSNGKTSASICKSHTRNLLLTVASQ